MSLRAIMAGGFDEFNEPRTLDTGRLSDEARERIVQSTRVGYVGVRRRCACGRFVRRGNWGCEAGEGCRR